MGIEDILEGVVNLWIGGIISGILLGILGLIYISIRPMANPQSQEMMDQLYVSGSSSIELLGMVSLLSFAVLIVLYARNR